jgi:hypothetical protein
MSKVMKFLGSVTPETAYTTSDTPPAGPENAKAAGDSHAKEPEDSPNPIEEFECF